MAAVKPITPAACRGECANITGYWRKVAALPMPVKKNIPNITPTNHGKVAIEVGVSKPPKTMAALPAIRPNPHNPVKMAPPNLSVSGPANTRMAEPINGPQKA